MMSNQTRSAAIPSVVAHTLETLECRRLLSASLSAGGTLTITGSNFFDNVIISKDPASPTTLVVSEKRKNLAPVITTFAISSINSIAVNLNDGDDQFVIDDTFGGVLAVPRTIDGGAGNDMISGGRGADTILGGIGNDTLSGRQGDDSIDGGTGNDFIHAGAGNDTVLGGDGNDSIEGCDGNDLLFGGIGNDVIDGLFGSDSIFGDAGEDILTGNFGNDGPDLPGDVDSITGGAGNDDFDPLDTASEIKDRTAADAGRNSYVATLASVNAIVNARGFQ